MMHYIPLLLPTKFQSHYSPYVVMRCTDIHKATPCANAIARCGGVVQGGVIEGDVLSV